MTTFKLTDKLTFGKYKSYTIEEVITDDPGYLEWCLDEIGWFELSDEASRALEHELDTRAMSEWADDDWYLG